MIKLVITIILLPILSLVFLEGRKAYWDNQVTKMCNKDGGIKIYDKTNKPLTYFLNKGFLKIPSEYKSTINNEYFLRTKNTNIVEGRLSVGEHRTQLIQRKGDMVIAEIVSFGRSGGDFPTFAHPSFYTCSTDKNLLESMFKEISNK